MSQHENPLDRRLVKQNDGPWMQSQIDSISSGRAHGDIHASALHELPAATTTAKLHCAGSDPKEAVSGKNPAELELPSTSPADNISSGRSHGESSTTFAGPDCGLSPAFGLPLAVEMADLNAGASKSAGTTDAQATGVHSSVPECSDTIPNPTASATVQAAGAATTTRTSSSLDASKETESQAPNLELPATGDATIPVVPVAGVGVLSDPTITTDTADPVLMITLLMTTGGKFSIRINKNYLRKHTIDAQDDDPFNLSIYTLKELIHRDWREEWGLQPSNPGSIRLIHFGRLLDDKSPVKECRFNVEAPNVVHMTVRPQEVVDEEDAKATKHGRDSESDARSPSCRCLIL